MKIATLNLAHAGADATGPVIAIGGAIWDSDIAAEPAREPFGWLDEDGAWVPGMPYHQILSLPHGLVGGLVEATASLEHGLLDSDIAGAPQWEDVRAYVERVLCAVDVIVLMDPRGIAAGHQRFLSLDWSDDFPKQGGGWKVAGIVELFHVVNHLGEKSYFNDQPLRRMAKDLGVSILDHHSIGAVAMTACRCLVTCCGPCFAEAPGFLWDMQWVCGKASKVGKVSAYGERPREMPPLLRVVDGGTVVLNRVIPDKPIGRLSRKVVTRLVTMDAPTEAEREALMALKFGVRKKARAASVAEAERIFRESSAPPENQ